MWVGCGDVTGEATTTFYVGADKTECGPSLSPIVSFSRRFVSFSLPFLPKNKVIQLSKNLSYILNSSIKTYL